MTSDKEREHQRYNGRAKLLLTDSLNDDELSIGIGINALPMALQAPYLYFESQIKKFVPDEKAIIMEIGAGTGAFTGTLLSTGANVCATDISEHSLEIIKKRFRRTSNLDTKVADMELLPFEDECIDLVACAGSLSYGDNKTVMNEIYRVLKRGGVFISVDSLNHNPIYRMNRWVHYLRGNRTLNTLKRMPTISLIESYGKKFGSVHVRYFGAISWLVPLLRKMFGEQRAATISDRVDDIFDVRKLAFKFVMVVKKEET